jgi:apolipoprotein N-acyltransferase
VTLGNAGQDYPLLPRLAPLAGVYGLSFVFAMLAAAANRPRREFAWLLVPLLGLPLLPAIPEPRAATHAVAAVQPNIPDEMEWTVPGVTSTIDTLTSLSLEEARRQRVDLIVWPEVPAPFYYFNDARFREPAQMLARVAATPFLFGTVGYTPQGAPLNSAVMIDRAGDFVGRYDKMYLVPFGEYLPPGFGWIQRITQEAGDFVPGERVSLYPFGPEKIGAFICYESAFPHLVRQFPRDGAQALFNLSNDGYFGRSAAREQHLLLVRMRALENRRWIVRATNDGITASIDPGGRIVARLEPYRLAAGRLPYDYESSLTPYTRWGDWFAWGCGLLPAAALITAAHRRARRATRGSDTGSR